MSKRLRLSCMNLPQAQASRMWDKFSRQQCFHASGWETYKRKYYLTSLLSLWYLLDESAVVDRPGDMAALWCVWPLFTRIPWLVADPKAALADLGLDGEDEVLLSPISLSWSSGWIDLSFGGFLQSSFLKIPLCRMSIRRTVCFIQALFTNEWAFWIFQSWSKIVPDVPGGTFPSDGGTAAKDAHRAGPEM